MDGCESKVLKDSWGLPMNLSLPAMLIFLIGIIFSKYFSNDIFLHTACVVSVTILYDDELIYGSSQPQQHSLSFSLSLMSHDRKVYQSEIKRKETFFLSCLMRYMTQNFFFPLFFSVSNDFFIFI